MVKFKVLLCKQDSLEKCSTGTLYFSPFYLDKSWTPWSEWSQCGVCGAAGGTKDKRTRVRTCNYPAVNANLGSAADCKAFVNANPLTAAITSTSPVRTETQTDAGCDATLPCSIGKASNIWVNPYSDSVKTDKY